MSFDVVGSVVVEVVVVGVVVEVVGKVEVVVDKVHGGELVVVVGVEVEVVVEDAVIVVVLTVLNGRVGIVGVQVGVQGV